MGYQADAVPGEGFLMYSNRVIRFEPSIRDDERSDTAVGRYLYIEAADSVWRIYPVYSLQEGVRLCPRRDWVIYTEGMGKTFQGNIERAAAMQQTYQVNVLLFDYASIASDLGMFKNFRLAMQNAASSHRQFDRLLDSVRQLRMASMWADQNITLFFHSMGNLVLQHLLQDPARLTQNSKPFIQQVILNAACVNRQGHHRWLRNLNFAEHIVIHYNRADYKLNGASFLSGNRKLGSKPRYPYHHGVRYVDFHAATGKTHNYFLDIPDRSFRRGAFIHAYYLALLHGQQPDWRQMPRSPWVGYQIPPTP